MKHLLRTLLLVAVCLIGFGDLAAQSYVSKPEAVQRLADEAKYASVLIDQLQDENQVTIQRNRLRVITALLHDLKRSEDVASSADRYIPSGDIRKLQIGIGQFAPTTTGYSNHLAWLRDDMLQLLTY